MELIKLGKDKYLVKNSNGKIINEKERLELENKNLIIKDFESKDCQKETTKKIKKNKNKIKELENLKALQDISPIVKGDIALQDEVSNEIIEETK